MNDDQLIEHLLTSLQDEIRDEARQSEAAKRDGDYVIIVMLREPGWKGLSPSVGRQIEVVSVRWEAAEKKFTSARPDVSAAWAETKTAQTQSQYIVAVCANDTVAFFLDERSTR